jgi:hypothetical protein
MKSKPVKEPTRSIPQRIVREVSRTWRGEAPSTDHPLVSQRFEMVIKANAKRGYALESWQLNSTVYSDGRQLIETIVAVFVRKE